MKKKRIIVGISGADGVRLAVRLLHTLREKDYETHLIITDDGWDALWRETGLDPLQVCKIVHAVYSEKDTDVPMVQSRWNCLGMIVVPCSGDLLEHMLGGHTRNLLLRMVDRTLKQGRPLVLVPTEFPQTSECLNKQAELAEQGTVILPPTVFFGSRSGEENRENLETMEDRWIRQILEPFAQLEGTAGEKKRSPLAQTVEVC